VTDEDLPLASRTSRLIVFEQFGIHLMQRSVKNGSPQPANP